MVMKDMRSNARVRLLNVRNVTNNNTVFGTVFDTSEYELGLMIAVLVRDYTNGTFNFTIDEADNLAFNNPVSILEGSEKLMGTLAELELTTGNPDGIPIPTIGLVSTLRYVRVNIVPTNVGVGGIVAIIAIQTGEYKPVVDE